MPAMDIIILVILAVFLVGGFFLGRACDKANKERDKLENELRQNSKK